MDDGGQGGGRADAATEPLTAASLDGGVPSDAFAADRDEATICYPLRGTLPVADEDELLLIEKQRGLGADMYNGPGGKVEPDESPAAAAVRETREEVDLDLDLASDGVAKRAEFDFYFGDEHVFFCHVYVATNVEGTASASPEAIPEWRPRSAIPYDQMWDDDVLWLPSVLDGETVRGVFYFDDDGDEMLDHALRVGVGDI